VDDSYDAPDPDGIEIGDDHQVKYFCWAPDRELNPQWANTPDVERAGCMIWHKRPDNGKQCAGAIHFDVPGAEHLAPADHRWQVQSFDPLTISPSVLCMRCGDHGFIRGGRWIRA
jgi:hypothetical protein